MSAIHAITLADIHGLLVAHLEKDAAPLDGSRESLFSLVLYKLTGYLNGDVTTKVLHGPKLVGIRLWIPQNARKTDLDLKSLLLPAPDGHLFPLGRVASFETISGQPQITREDSRRMVAITARIAGRDLGSTVRDVRKALDKSGFLPKTVPYTLGGLYEEQQIAFKGLTIVLVAAIILVVLLLLFLYESFGVTIAMLITTLLAVAAVYIGLWITGTEFNITSRMGMTMIVGIVTEVAIFYLSEFQDLQDQENQFVIAGINRMRPIAMTTFAAILALLPLALGIGEGSSMLKPLAIAIISGLVFQLLLSSRSFAMGRVAHRGLPERTPALVRSDR